MMVATICIQYQINTELYTEVTVIENYLHQGVAVIKPW